MFCPMQAVPDLTMEAVLLQPQFRSLFSKAELRVAAERLGRYGKEATIRIAKRKRLYPDELEAWHTLRHTFASRLSERGVDIMTVKELLGHSTVTVTMRYTHSHLDSKVAAVGKLAGDCYNPATVGPKLQEFKPKVSQIGR